MSNKSKKASPIRKLQSEMSASASCNRVLNRARLQLTAPEYLSFLSWSLATKRKGQSLLHNYNRSLFPRKMQQLKAVPVFAEIDPGKELIWCCSVLLLYKSSINKFIELSGKLEQHLINGKHDESLVVADQIQTAFGHSIWLIETKTALYQIKGGLEAQKEYLKTIKEQGASNIPWLAATFSQRNEDTTTFFRFANQLIESLADLESDDLRNYLLYRAIDLLPSSGRSQACLLRYESNAALIDLYASFMRVMQESIAENDHPLKNSAVYCLNIISDQIIDPRISRMLYISGLCLEAAQTPFANYEQFEDPDSCSSIGQLAESSNWPGAWSAAAESLLQHGLPASNGDSFGAQVLASLHSIYDKGNSADNVINKELKRCLNLRNFSASKVLDEILWHELSSEPFHDAGKGLIRFINTPHLDPTLLVHLPPNARLHYGGLLKDAYPNSSLTSSLLWQLDLQQAQEKVAPLCHGVTYEQIKASKLLIEKKLDESINANVKLLSNNNVRVRRLAARKISKALLLKDDTEKLIDFVSLQCTNDADSINLLPIHQCAEKLDKKTRKQLAGKISTPIILSHYARIYDEQYDKPLAYAYEDFLIKHKLRKPSETVSLIGEIDTARLIYYLRYICIPEIMKISTEFNGSAEVQEERLVVCSLLLKLDETNTKIYESEIREITRAQIIRKGVRHVEQSKMSIDTAAIRKWADKKLKESFLRYKGLVEGGFNPLAGFQEALLESLSAGKPMPKEFFEVPTDEAGALLKDITYSIIQECTISPMHGLDCYLSMRVRHGALSGQLRGPLEAERIITQRQSDQGSYAPNEYWYNQLHILPQSGREKVILNLCVFAAEYDALIEKTTNELIQITTKDKPEGIFNITFSYADLRLVAINITEDTSFDDYFDLCIDLFWRRVEACLENVQRTIDYKLKPAVNALFNIIQDPEELTYGRLSSPELDRAIRTAQTHSIQALEQLKDWFRIPAPRSEPPFEIEELIDIGLQCVQRIHKDFNPIITKVIPTLPPLANALTLFSDIFFIIFDNIRKYASNGTTPYIEINVVRVRDAISISVGNDVNITDSTLKEIDLKVLEIKRKIQGDKYQNAVKSEGGTGLIKLRKLIGPSQTLDFGHDGKERFFVTFSLSLHEIDL